MIAQEDQDEFLAAAQRMQNTTTAAVQSPAGANVGSPEYVKAETAGNVVPPAPVPAPDNKTVSTGVPVAQTSVGLKPIDNGVKTLQLIQTADMSKSPAEDQPAQPEPAAPKETVVSAAPDVNVRIGSDLPEMKAGEKIKIPVVIQGSANFRSGVIGLKFDNKQIAIRSITYGDVFGSPLATSAATPFLNQNGKMYVSLTAKDESGAKADGTLAYIEIEALASGRPRIAFDNDVLNFLTADGKNFQIRLAK
jgi:hypothetical protein